MPQGSEDRVYGLNPAFEVVRAGRRRIARASLSSSSKGNARLRKLASYLESSQVPTRWCDKGVLQQLAGTRQHQGVVIECSSYPYVDSAELIETSDRLVLLDNLEDPHNVGAILRTAEVLGIPGALLPRRGVPPILPSVVKAAAGATEFMRIAQDRSANRYARTCQEGGWHIAALDARGADDPAVLGRVDGPLLLVVGGENRGVRQYILNSADSRIAIPQQGRVSSLNASVAAAIALFSMTRCRDTTPEASPEVPTP